MNADIIPAERAVLGSQLRDNGCIGDVLLIVRADDFTADAHRKIFSAVSYLFDQGKPADLVTTGALLQQRGVWDDTGGPLLAELWDAAPTAADAVYYARIVHDASILRRLSFAASEIESAANARTAPADEQLEEAEKAIFAIAQLGAMGQTVSLGSALTDALKRVDARMERGAEVAVSTGFVDLDALTCGFQDGELVILAARPSCGKTAFALSVIRSVIAAGMPVLFVSLEQSRVELAERLLCSQASVNSHRLRRGILSSDELDALATAAGDLQRGAVLHIDDTACQGITRIGANARRLRMRHGIRLLVVDYLQLIDPDDRCVNRQEQVATFTRRLKHLARELRIPVLALAQLNREVEARAGGRPKLSDLRESGAVEQDADVVLLMHRVSEHGNTDLIEVQVAKQRNGPIGAITLAFSRPFMRFENYTVGTPYDMEDNA